MGQATPHPGMPPRFVSAITDALSRGEVVVALDCGHRFQFLEQGLYLVARDGPQGGWLYLNCAHCQPPPASGTPSR